MKRKRLDQMAQVTEAIYLAEFRKVQPLFQEESRLRSALAQLHQQAESERATLATDTPMQSIGADLLWHAWLERTRKELNIELSQILAKKSVAMTHVRLAFGRRSAVQSMHANYGAEQESSRRKNQMNTLLQAHICE